MLHFVFFQVTFFFLQNNARSRNISILYFIKSLSVSKKLWLPVLKSGFVTLFVFWLSLLEYSSPPKTFVIKYLSNYLLQLFTNLKTNFKFKVILINNIFTNFSPILLLLTLIKLHSGSPLDCFYLFFFCDRLIQLKFAENPICRQEPMKQPYTVILQSNCFLQQNDIFDRLSFYKRTP